MQNVLWRGRLIYGFVVTNAHHTREAQADAAFGAFFHHAQCGHVFWRESEVCPLDLPHLAWLRKPHLAVFFSFKVFRLCVEYCRRRRARGSWWSGRGDFGLFVLVRFVLASFLVLLVAHISLVMLILGYNILILILNVVLILILGFVYLVYFVCFVVIVVVFLVFHVQHGLVVFSDLLMLFLAKSRHHPAHTLVCICVLIVHGHQERA
mmetsp:Transcript_13023/g.25551  ORF Transcript_13023/g.25551 Transcript_13023/m.25551 type:complete len:208 (-) Transcript_13023:86-709(-)